MSVDHRKILLVEDNAGDVLAIRQILAALPIRISVARDGEQAIQILEDPEFKPDLIRPLRFDQDVIGVAESTGLVGPLTMTVMKQALSEAVTWPPNLKVAVNISPVQFMTKDFVGIVRDAMTSTGIKPSRLELEVTGHMAASNLVHFLTKTVKVDRMTKLFAGIRDIEGMARPTFRLVGPLNQPGGVTFAGGEITAQYVSFNHTALPERLTGLQGRFILAEGATQFEQVTGHVGCVVLLFCD